MAAILSRGRWVNVFIIAKHFLCLPTRGTWFNWYRAYIFQCFICLNEMCVFVCDVCVCANTYDPEVIENNLKHTVHIGVCCCVCYTCVCAEEFFVIVHSWVCLGMSVWLFWLVRELDNHNTFPQHIQILSFTACNGPNGHRTQCGIPFLTVLNTQSIDLCHSLQIINQNSSWLTYCLQLLTC